MATKEQIRDNVASRLHRQSLSDVIEGAIDKAINYYNGRRFWFSEGRKSFTVSSGATAYTLSTSMVSVIAVTVTRSGNTYQIEPVPEKERLAYQTNSVTGDPSWYALYKNTFIPYPAPNQTYTVEISGTRKEASITTSGSNAFTVHAEELIEARAGWYVASYHLHDHEFAQLYKMLEAEAIHNLQRQEALRSTNRVTPTEF